MSQKGHTDFYVRVTAYNHTTNEYETLNFFGSTREQAEGRYKSWLNKAGRHFEVDSVQYGKTYDNTGA